MRTVLSLFAVAFALGVVLAAPVPKEKKDDFGPITDEHLKASENNLKQIGIALHNHHDVFGFLPNNTVVDKKPGLSWRVHLLPYLECDDIYKQFALDEAWDSKTNKPLVEKMPDIFAPVRVKTKEKGMTFYQGFVGGATAFQAERQLKMADFLDGTSNTIAVVEAGEPVIWTKPDDLLFDAAKPLPKLGGLFDGDFHVVLMDGSVQKATGAKVDEKQFKLMVTRNDGTVVNPAAAFGHK